MDLIQTARRHPRATAVIVLVGLASIVFGMLWFTPWRLFTDDPVSEGLPPTEPTVEKVNEAGSIEMSMFGVEARGEFISLEHDSRGRALVLETRDGRRFLRFEEFETSNGPDLLVYLSSKTPAGSDDWYGYDQDFVDLGPLKGNLGDQNYEIPDGVDLSRYSTAVVWCRRFEVGFAAATLS
ncbi:MAG TPA: DM13 domain-containing protein [Actinomycetota bacterium]|nr:DM13 domain-containing protein [Actinomycetota bacterium]